MKKDSAVKNAERKSAIIKKLKSMAGSFIALLVILVGILVVVFYKPPVEETKSFETRSYAGEDETFVMENDSLRFELDGNTTHFAVTDKNSGAVWYSNPPEAANDPIAQVTDKASLQSTLILTFSTTSGTDTIYNNYQYSIENGLYEIEQGDDYVKVCYTVGVMEKEYIFPMAVTEARMKELIAEMDPDVQKRVQGYYKKYDINKLGKKDNKEELLELYPLLETEVLYILRDNSTENIMKLLERTFAEIGYSYEDYLMDKEMVEGTESESSERPVFNVNVVYRLNDDKFTVEVPMGEIEYLDNYPIYYLSILPYFGAGSTEDEGYLLVPEGGGALINFNNGKTLQSSYYANMYGWDFAQYREDLVHETNTYFNAFAIARNGSSMMCILEDGAPYSGVFADISGRLHSYNYVYAQYTLLHREVYEIAARSSSLVYMYEDQIPQESIVQSYRFLDTDSYTDMALAYHDYMQETYGGLLTENEEAQTPAVIEIVGAVDKVKQVAGIPVSRPLPLTTYKEAQSMLEQLQADGLGNMSVKLSGWMNGGVQQKLLDDVHLVSGLGSKKDLQELSDYASANGIDLYLNGITNYAYDSDIFDGFLSFRDAARYASRKRAEIHPYSTVTFADREGQEPHYLLHATLIPEMVDNLVGAADQYGANVSFEDIGMELSSDFYKKGVVTRQTVMDDHVQMLSGIKESGKKVMLNMGNNYAIPFSDIVTNMDLSGSDYTILDETVPVYQMAVHGYISYTGEPLNLTQNEEEELLRSAEYGAGLAFTLMDETAFTLQNTLYTEYFGAEYDSWHDELVAIYTRYDKELGHIFSQRMMGHERLTVDLTCTEYEDGTKVYVNYGFGPAVTPDGAEVPARDYLVVR